MDKHSATEIAFKNGYEQGYKDAVKEICDEANRIIKETNGEYIYKETLEGLTKKILMCKSNDTFCKYYTQGFCRGQKNMPMVYCEGNKAKCNSPYLVDESWR